MKIKPVIFFITVIVITCMLAACGSHRLHSGTSTGSGSNSSVISTGDDIEQSTDDPFDNSESSSSTNSGEDSGDDSSSGDIDLPFVPSDSSSSSSGNGEIDLPFIPW